MYLSEILHVKRTHLHHFQINDSTVINGLDGCCGNGQGGVGEGWRGGGVTWRTVVKENGIKELH